MLPHVRRCRRAGEKGIAARGRLSMGCGLPGNTLVPSVGLRVPRRRTSLTRCSRDRSRIQYRCGREVRFGGTPRPARGTRRPLSPSRPFSRSRGSFLRDLEEISEAQPHRFREREKNEERPVDRPCFDPADCRTMNSGSLGENLVRHAGNPPLLLEELGQMDDQVLRVWFAHQEAESMPGENSPTCIYARTLPENPHRRVSYCDPRTKPIPSNSMHLTPLQ